MLLRASSRRCHCSSTSTADPCKHSTIRSVSSSSTSTRPRPRPPPASTTTSDPNAPDSPFLRYPAPLWEGRWFAPNHRSNKASLQSWIAKSRSTPSQQPSPLFKPPPIPTPAPPPPIATPTPDFSRLLLQKYLSFRSASSSRPLLIQNVRTNVVRILLLAAKECEMPLVERLILADLEKLREKEGKKQWRLPFDDLGEEGMKKEKKKVVPWENQRERLRTERREAKEEEAKKWVEFDRMKDEGMEGEMKGRGFREMLEAGHGEEEEGKLPMWVDARKVMEDLIRTSDDQSIILPPHLIVGSSSPTASEKLADLWTTFLADSSLNSDTQTETQTDLSLVLSFLHLLTTSSSSSESPHLPLALKVLQTLLSTNDTFSLANPPSSASLPHATNVQFVILRTLTSISISSPALFPIAKKSLLSIATLRALHSIPPEDEDADLELLQETLSAITTHLREARQVEYAPRVPLGTPSTHPLLIAHFLVHDLLPRWTPIHSTSASASSPILSSYTSQLISGYTTEAAKRIRWDLVGQTWSRWSSRPRRRSVPLSSPSSSSLPPALLPKWTLPSHHLKLLRWYSGEAPFSTYGISGPEIDNNGHSIRVVDGAKVYDLALDTLRAFMRDKNLWENWGEVEKSEWIGLLSGGRASSRRTRSLARAFYKLWTINGGEEGVVLTAKALLGLVRTSCAPYGTQEVFAAGVVRRRVESMSGANGSGFDHFELTALAHCYLLLGDQDSMKGVYKRMLDLRIIPTQKDVEVIIKAAIRRSPGLGLWYLKDLWQKGWEIRRETFEMAMVETCAVLAEGKGERERAVKRLFRLYERRVDGEGERQEELEELRNVRDRLLAETMDQTAHSVIRSGEFDELDPSRTKRLIREAINARQFPWMCELYSSAIVSSFSDEETLRFVLRELSSTKTGVVHHAWKGKEFVEDALKRGLVERKGTGDAVLRYCVVSGDWEAAERVGRVLRGRR
ncbi:hypothetical protein P7C70_g6718, partial [Phenoliferia sp. Uapishka_3]